MKIHALSDLHLGCCPLDPIPAIGDVLVLAGDVTDGRRDLLFAVASNYLRLCRPVLFVPGNHEFYGHAIARELLQLSRECRHRGIELLHNRSIVIDGVRFAGTTLWTDFQLERQAYLSMIFAKQGIADFTCIAHRQRSLTPEATVRFHRRALRFLERVFQSPHAGPTVVVTHHGPHPRSIHKRFARHPLNPAFISDLSEQLNRWAPNLWIHGHVHNRFDYRVGKTRIVTNPRGYESQTRLVDGTIHHRRENLEFDPALLLHV